MMSRDDKMDSEWKQFEILLFEDDPADAIIIEDQLWSTEAVHNARLTRVERLADGLNQLRRQRFDLALLDLSLPDSKGIETFEKLHRAAPDLPVIVVTGLHDELVAFRILREGAQDYLPKNRIGIGDSIARAIHVAIERNRLRVELSRRAEQLAKSEASVRSIIESSSDAILVVDRDGKVHFANPTAGVMFRRKTNELLAHPFGFPLAAEEATELDIICLDGEPGIAEMRVSEMEWDGQPAYLVSLHDVTDRKRSEQQIQELNATLERRVTARTVQLEAANRELDSFCHSVSHDLRTPVRHIAGFASILNGRHRTQLDSDGQRCLNQILESTARMNELIDDLLNLSRVSRADLTIRPVNLGALARRVVDKLRVMNPDRRVEVEMGDDIPVMGDSGLLLIVLENLLGNAWKFTSKKSEGYIEVGSFRNPAGGRICFVRDNGAGFDMQYAGKLFGTFQRMHGEDEFPGTGVGLATVRRIINRHGGRIWAEAAPDQGATFFFTLEHYEQTQAAADEIIKKPSGKAAVLEQIVCK
jgi:signal transduction histidine kinase